MAAEVECEVLLVEEDRGVVAVGTRLVEFGDGVVKPLDVGGVVLAVGILPNFGRRAGAVLRQARDVIGKPAISTPRTPERILVICLPVHMVC